MTSETGNQNNSDAEQDSSAVEVIDIPIDDSEHQPELRPEDNIENIGQESTDLGGESEENHVDMAHVDVLLEEENHEVEQGFSENILNREPVRVPRKDEYNYNVSIRDAGSDNYNDYQPLEDVEDTVGVSGINNINYDSTEGILNINPEQDADLLELGIAYEEDQKRKVIPVGLEIQDEIFVEPEDVTEDDYDDQEGEVIDVEPEDVTEDDYDDQEDGIDDIEPQYSPIGKIRNYHANDWQKHPEKLHELMNRSTIVEEDDAIVLNPNYDNKELLPNRDYDDDAAVMGAGGALNGAMFAAATTINPALGLVAGAIGGFGLGKAAFNDQHEYVDIDGLDDDVAQTYREVMQSEMGGYQIFEADSPYDYDSLN